MRVVCVTQAGLKLVETQLRTGLYRSVCVIVTHVRHETQPTSLIMEDEGAAIVACTALNDLFEYSQRGERISGSPLNSVSF